HSSLGSLRSLGMTEWGGLVEYTLYLFLLYYLSYLSSHRFAQESPKNKSSNVCSISNSSSLSR
ncbi:hypothetical protein KBB05_05690, partial [Patescibacteria group bacterium]|nr:hypothetical protein [Patescibacteria group bacterium]